MDLYTGKQPLARLSKRYTAELVDGSILTVAGGALIVAALASDVPFLFPASVVGASAIALAYDTLYIARRGQTPGKRAAGIRVVMFGGGTIPTVGASFRRALVKLLFGLPGLSLILYLTVFFSLNRRGPHDVAAGTVVVSDR